MPPKPKLTPEEKKAARRHKKEERKKRAEERKKQVKRDHLYREIVYSALTTKKHEKEWRDMLMKIALPRMREELQFAWNHFERIVDCKDFTISLLMDELRDAEEQYMMSYRNHMENIERLIRMFKDRLGEFKEDYNLSIENLEDDGEREVKYLSDLSGIGNDYLKTMIYGLEQDFKEQERQLKVENTSKIDDKEMKYGEAIQRMKAYLENMDHQLWGNTHQFLHDFFHRTKERKKAHDALKNQDDSVQGLIYRQLIKITNAQDHIKRLKEKLADAQELSAVRINDLEIERNFFSDAFLKLKCRLVVDRKLDAEKMRVLTVQSLKALEHLEGVEKRGEHILQLAAICRKLETQKEKILPFPKDSNVVETSQQENEQVNIENLDVRLQLFWQRVGQANSLRFAINEEKMFLQLQNKVVKKQIHSYECTFCTKMHFEKQRYGLINVVNANMELTKYCTHVGSNQLATTNISNNHIFEST